MGIEGRFLKLALRICYSRYIEGVDCPKFQKPIDLDMAGGDPTGDIWRLNPLPNIVRLLNWGCSIADRPGPADVMEYLKPIFLTSSSPQDSRRCHVLSVKFFPCNTALSLWVPNLSYIHMSWRHLADLDSKFKRPRLIYKDGEPECFS